MALEFIPSDWVNLRGAGADLAALQNVGAATLMAWVDPDWSTKDFGVLALSIGSASPTADSRATLELRKQGIIRAGGRALDGDATKYAASAKFQTVADEWQHVAGVLDYANDSIFIYRNAVLLAENLTAGFGDTSTSDTPSRSAAVGSEEDGSNDFFDGLIADARVYSRGLILAELEAIVACRGLDGIADGLQHRFLFDEKAPGAAAGGAAGDVVDVGPRQRTQVVAIGGPLYAESILRFTRRAA